MIEVILVKAKTVLSELSIEKIRKMFDVTNYNKLNVTTVLGGVTVGLLVYYVVKRIRYRLPPGPMAIPLVGHYSRNGDLRLKTAGDDVHEQWKNQTRSQNSVKFIKPVRKNVTDSTVYSATDLHQKISDIAKKYGPVVQIQMGPFPWIFLNDIDTVLEAMVKRGADFAGRPVFDSLNLMSEGGKDIAMADYSPVWKVHRKIAGKALRHYLQGDLLENMIADNLSKFMDKMAEEKEPFKIKDYIDKMVFHQLFTMCFGENRSIDDPDVLHIIKLEEDAIAQLGSGLLEDIVPYLKDICPTKKWKMIQEMTQEFLDFVYKYFNEHKRTFDTNVNRDFTDSLLHARAEAEREDDKELLDKLDDTHLAQTVSDIFFAGVDTTRMTLDWFMLFMSGLPEIQAKCQAEIDENIGSRRPSMKDRGNLDYTEACLFETMRLGAVAAIGVPHKTLCDTKVGGYDIPKGSVVVINHWALHHDPNYWPEPEKFDPTRYLDDKGKLDMNKRESWLPFSAGRRVCLGEAVAKPEMLLLITHFLQRFKISLPPGVQPNLKPNIVAGGLELPHEYKVVITERN